MIIDYKKQLNEIYATNKVNSSLSKRIHSYVDDEPLTIEWIKSFKNNSIFYDIGSNIGGFSFIASNIKDIKVFSFEPNFENFYICLNAVKKNQTKNIFPLNIALNNVNEFNYFKYGDTRVGSKGTFGKELKTQLLKSQYGNPFKRGISLEVGILGVSLDNLIYDFNMPIPNYIKIDVDGNDLLILLGAERLLNEPNLKEIFIEIDDKIYEKNEIETLMQKYSFNVEKNINVGTDKKPMRMVLYKR